MQTTMRDAVRWALRAKARRVALALALEGPEVRGYWPQQSIAERGWGRTAAPRSALVSALAALEERGLVSVRLVRDADRTYRVDVLLDEDERLAVLDAAGADFARDQERFDAETEARRVRVEEAASALREALITPFGGAGWRSVADRAAELSAAALSLEGRAREIHTRAWHADQRRLGRI